MDVTSIADLSTQLSLSQTQDAASTLVLKSAVEFEKSSGEAAAQMLYSIPPSDCILDMKV